MSDGAPETLFEWEQPPDRRPGPVVDAAELVRGLTPAQRAAVEHRGGPLLIVAGAGSGKTRVLTRRIAHLIATRTAAPWQILAITFTNKAADEMRRRVVDLVGPRGERMWVSTFHSAGVRILRAHGDLLGYKGSFTIYDDADSRRLVELVCKELDIDTKRMPPRSILGQISQAKSRQQGPDEYRRTAVTIFDRRIADVFDLYQQRMVAANAMDFDDLLLNTVRLFRQHPEVLEHYRQRFTHVLIDEFQDTNAVQNALATLLADQHRNIVVVGDSDQSVYRFRGADITNILEFEQAFPDATVVTLDQNFRSTQTILDAANAVIANNVSRKPKTLWTDGGTASPSPATGPRTSTTRRRGWPGRSAGSSGRRGCPGGTWPSSTGPTPRAVPSRRRWSPPRCPTRWWGGPSSTTAARSRTSSPTSGCWSTRTTRSAGAGWSTSPSGGSATPRSTGWPCGRTRTGPRSGRRWPGPPRPG